MKNIKQTLENMGLSIKYTFIPFSQSRNKGEKYPSLNFLATVYKGDKPVLTTDYGMGCAHVPGYKQNDRRLDHAEKIKRACETGNAGDYFYRQKYVKPHKIEPKIEDVFYSLTMDSDVLNESSFEDWASNYGYDIDSRKAEKIYKECMEIALKLKAAIGFEGLETLRELFEDY